MKIVYKYSISEEIKNLIDLIKNHNDYKNQKGLNVEYPNIWNCLAMKLNEKLICFILRNLVHKRPSIDLALKELGLENNLKQITCYLHTFGCGGWFNIDKKEVHVRWDYHANRFIDTLIHEILHLITYDEKFDYSTREKVVERYMETPEIQNIING